MKYSFTVPGKLAGYNQLNSGHWRTKGDLKAAEMDRVMWAVRLARPKLPRFTNPVVISITCFEPDARRDGDNVNGGACKIILDALQHFHIIKGDGRKYIADLIVPYPQVDRERPRVEVVIEEVE